MAGHRVRGARGAAIAVAAMAALTASQAPGAVPARASVPQREAPVEHGPSVSGDTPYRTALPPLRARERKGGASVRGAAGAGAALPASVFAAYRRAEAELARTAPGCRLRWQLLAAIGQVESGQARGGRVTADGTTVAPILGPRLDGGAFAVVRDTDGGAYDGDPAYDRAVGPMQFIPSTWARWGMDGNGDGRADPGNVFDAALAAGRYLCAGGRDLSDPAGLDRAVLGYNHSQAYLRTVRAWYAYFLEGHRVVPDSSATGSRRSEPSQPKPVPKPTPKPSPSPRPSASPSRTPSAPGSPTPGTSRPSAGATETREPQLPAPGTDIELPGDDLLPSGAPLGGNGVDSMASTPSTTADTGR
ncbi:lytic transglycosylase domain-containing protein [Streptomyces canus]|uniref:lytic transglycosylase domain-containing protein n=1 Tax=Streptomyces canus TaxID=58343 RepID=UPI00278450BA|nr:lytic murein transglycosylase [Streptomyces canus]MDQ0763272.1 membrane-bound lytic murein transglycosylase B [Streptomyces canus]